MRGDGSNGPNHRALTAFVRRHWRRPLWIAAGIYGAFLLVLNGALNFPPDRFFLNPSDRSSSINWGWAWGLVPGWATAHDFYLTVEDDNIQLGLRIQRARVRYAPLAFLHQTFHATAVTAEGVSFRFRLKKTAEQIARLGPEGLAALPQIAGFAEIPLRGPESPPFQGDRSIYWTIHIEGVRAYPTEIWVEAGRYLGPARAFGSFTLRPLTVVEVDAGLDLQGGELMLENNPLAKRILGTLGVKVDRFDPLPETGVEPLQHISTQLTLDGELQNVGLLNPVFNRLKAPSFESSAGHFDLISLMDHGRFVPGSRFDLQAARWEIARGRYRAVGTDTQIEGSIEEAPGGGHGTVSILLGPYQVLDPQLGEELFEGDGMILRMLSDRLSLLDHPFSDLGFEVQLESARLPDLTVLNAYVPRSDSFEVLGGSGEVSGQFSRPSEGPGSGNFRIEAKDAAVRVRQVKIQGEGSLRAQLSGLASSAQELPILGRDRLGGVAELEGHFTVQDLGRRYTSSSTPVPLNQGGARPANGGGTLASFATTASLVVHPLVPSEVMGAQIVKYLSGELKLEGAIPGLEFLNGTLRDRGIALRGGAGELTIDARLTHGVLGRASALDFTSRALELQGQDVQGSGDLAVRANVEEGSFTPQVTAMAAVSAARLGSADLPALIKIRDLSLTASEPELDLEALPELHPELALSARQLVLSDLSILDRWLPQSLRIARGRAEVGLTGRSPVHGTGSLKATVAVEGLAGTAGPLAVSGQLSGSASLAGLAEEPWKPDLLGRSKLDANAVFTGRCDLTAASAENRSAAHLHFRAEASLPPTPGGQIASRTAIDRVSGEVGVSGQVDNLAYLNRFLASAPVKLEGGSASLEARLELAGATLAPGSKLALDTRDLALAFGRLRLAGPLHVAAELGPPDSPARDQVRATLSSFTLRDRFADQLLARGAGLDFALQAESLSPERLLLDSTFQGRATQVELPDLGALSTYFPATKDFRLLSGSATASGTLDHPSRDHGEAKLEVGLHRAQIELSGKPLTADVRVAAQLRALTEAGINGKPLLETVDVAGSTVDLSEVSFGTSHASDREWWAKLRVVRGELGFDGEPRGKLSLSGDTQLEARDALPWLHLYGGGLGIPGWLDGLLAFNRLKATAALEMRGNRFAVPSFQADGDHLQLQGRLLLTDQHTSGDFLLEVGPFSLGVDVRDKRSGVQLLGAESWYRDRLKQPLE